MISQEWKAPWIKNRSRRLFRESYQTCLISLQKGKVAKKYPFIKKIWSNLWRFFVISRKIVEPSPPKTPTATALKKDVPVLEKKPTAAVVDKSKPTVSASLDMKALPKNKTQSASPQKNFSRNKSFASSVKTKASLDQPRRYIIS